MSKTKVLILPIEKKWFDMLLDGTKKEEYRELKYYYVQRLALQYESSVKDGKRNVYFDNKDLKRFDQIIFRNGYSANSPAASFEHLGTSVGLGRLEWGAPEKQVFIIQIGKLIAKQNIK